MPKPKRGKQSHTIKDWRGTCPVCNRTGVKVLWEKTEGEKTQKVCKICGA
jgi:transcription elongation factor Elf1